MKSIVPCLWFDHQAEEAARFYVSIFKKSKIVHITRYGDVGREVTGKEPGSVLSVDFRLGEQSFTALNGGPQFKFNEAMSLQVFCATQKEIDYYWEKLGAGGDPEAQQCGWLKDKYGLSWQIVPEGMMKMLKDPKSKAYERVFSAMLGMKKLDIAKLNKAFAG